MDHKDCLVKMRVAGPWHIQQTLCRICETFKEKFIINTHRTVSMKPNAAVIMFIFIHQCSCKMDIGQLSE